MAYKKIDITEIVSSVATLGRLLANDYHSKKDEMVKDILGKLANDQFVVDEALNTEVVTVMDGLHFSVMKKLNDLKMLISTIPNRQGHNRGNMVGVSDIERYVRSDFPPVMIKVAIEQMLSSGELELDLYVTERVEPHPLPGRPRDITITPYFNVVKKVNE